MHTQIPAYLHKDTCMHTHVHTYKHAYIQAIKHTHEHRYIHTYIHTNTHTHTTCIIWILYFMPDFPFTLCIYLSDGT